MNQVPILIIMLLVFYCAIDSSAASHEITTSPKWSQRNGLSDVDVGRSDVGNFKMGKYQILQFYSGITHRLQITSY